MHLGIDFWMDFGGFWEGKWKQVGANIGAQIDIGVKAEKSIKHKRASAKLGSEGPRREAKSIKNRLKIEVQDSMPLWHRYIIDVGGFLEGKLGRKTKPKCFQNRFRKASTKRCLPNGQKSQ